MTIKIKEVMRDKVLSIWPEINWIENKELREKVLDCWVYAVENSVLTIEDLETIPFSLLIKDCKISFMNHKRTAVQLSVDIAKRMKQNFGNEIQIDMDMLIAGAILIDVGKLIEYDKVNGQLTTSKAGKILRHPFSGVSIADRFGIPYEVQHIIAYHAKEGDLAKRSVEAIIVHHADFVSFDPFKA
jgi:putative nucleotidyltransferase with HDIG domain